MPLTPEEDADLKIALKPVRKMVHFSIACVLGAFIFPMLGMLILLPLSSLLFFLGYQCYQMNLRRIAEGKTSITVGRGSRSASYNHKLNQSVNQFYMILGGIIAITTILAPLRWLFS